MDKIQINNIEHGICITIPLKNDGKFRFKKRKNPTEFGIGFATRNKQFSHDSYLEWQIGFDAEKNSVTKGKKTTSLTNYIFKGSNGKDKYLYELSEIVWKLCEKKLINKPKIMNLISEISTYGMFILENFQIKMEKAGTEIIEGKKSIHSKITLPTFTFDAEKEKEIFTEISIEKQQHATSFQPMLYVIVPVQAFDNANDIIGKNSTQMPLGYYTITTKKRAENFLKIFSYFGLCSEKHQHDVLEILKIICDNAF